MNTSRHNNYLHILLAYRIKTKSPKWYKRILFHFMDLSLCNAYLLRKAMTGESKLTLIQFKLQVATALMFAETPSIEGTPVISDIQRAANGDPVGNKDPPEAQRRDEVNHWAENVAKIGRRCRLKGCNARSVLWCRKCHVYLCLINSRNCFVEYHRSLKELLCSSYFDGTTFFLKFLLHNNS